MIRQHIFFILSVLALCIPAQALKIDDNDTTPKKPRGVWTHSSSPSILINEKLYNNWSAAGNSLLSIVTNFDGTYKYTHDHYILDNVVKLGYGTDMQDLDANRHLESRRKTEDKIDLTSTLSYRAISWANVNISLNYKTQFADGWNFTGPGNDDGTLVSKFMAPGYITLSLGFEHKEDAWNVSVSPLSGKSTMVLSEEVIEAGQLYGVDTADGKRIYNAFGAYVRFYFKKDIFKDFNLYTRIELFYDYRKPHLMNWDEIEGNYDKYYKRVTKAMSRETDVNFEMTINYKLRSFLHLSASLNLKYDTDYVGIGQYGHWQLFQTAGLRFIFKWPK